MNDRKSLALIRATTNDIKNAAEQTRVHYQATLKDLRDDKQFVERLKKRNMGLTQLLAESKTIQTYQKTLAHLLRVINRSLLHFLTVREIEKQPRLTAKLTNTFTQKSTAEKDDTKLSITEMVSTSTAAPSAATELTITPITQNADAKDNNQSPWTLDELQTPTQNLHDTKKHMQENREPLLELGREKLEPTIPNWRWNIGFGLLPLVLIAAALILKKIYNDFNFAMNNTSLTEGNGGIAAFTTLISLATFNFGRAYQFYRMENKLHSTANAFAQIADVQNANPVEIIIGSKKRKTITATSSVTEEDMKRAIASLSSAQPPSAAAANQPDEKKSLLNNNPGK